MPNLRKRLGNIGEHAAAMYLARQGYQLVARKWRCASGELDLVMRDGATLVFVEVRARRGAPGSAEESVGRAKQGRLIALAYAYLAAIGAPEDTAWRIDVVALDLDRHGHVVGLRHIRDAVEES
jgi:putative endonuclease